MNKTEWNTFVREHAPHALFQSWEWGEVEKKLGHRVWRLEWNDAVAQVVKVAAKRGIFLHVRHGPVGKIHVADLKRLARQEGAWFIRISPQISAFSEKGFVPAPIHAMDAEISWVLDLDKSEEELLAGMRKSTRYEIRHAQGIRVQKTKNLERFFRLYRETSKRHGFIQHKGILEEYETFGGICYVASAGGEDLAAAVITDFGSEAIYRHGASVKTTIPASYAIQWQAIRDAKNRGKKLYNFWGIAPDDGISHPWRGLTVFKKGFGGREIRFIHAQDLQLSPLYRISRAVELVRKKLRGYT